MFEFLVNWTHQEATVTYGVYLCHAILWLFGGWVLGTITVATLD